MEPTTQLPGARRSLTAIVFTDAVGFSAMASHNEARALELLQDDLTIVREACKRYGGRVIKGTGDGLLLCFDSAVEAVRCAVDVQDSFTARSGEGLLQHRISVHLGDVVITEEDAFGDGVNVASRLQSLAKPGGIAVSQVVFEVIRGKVPCRCVYEGEKTLKGINSPLQVWSVTPGEGVVGRPRARLQVAALFAAPALLVLAIGLAIYSGGVQKRASEDVKRANEERDHVLQMLQNIDGGSAVRDMQFGRLKSALADAPSAQKPDPERQQWVARLDGLENWKTWLERRLNQTTPDRPVTIKVKTATSSPPVTVWTDKQKGLQFKQGDQVKSMKLEQIDPEMLQELSDAFGESETPPTQAQIQKWVKDYTTIAKRLHRLPSGADPKHPKTPTTSVTAGHDSSSPQVPGDPPPIDPPGSSSSSDDGN